MASTDAQGAADAQVLVDEGDRARALHAVGGIDRDDGTAGHPRQPRDAFHAARRAAVDVGLAAGDRFGVRAAGGIAALRTLRLRQLVFDQVGERFCHGGQAFAG
jgi:hypothetical protein